MYQGSVFYCDESGHTGFNLLSTQQHFYVAGGSLVPAGRENELATLVESAQREQHELKFSSFAKSAEGLALAESLLQRSSQLGCIHFYVVYEMRFNVAQKVVDVLMDPYKNTRAQWLPVAAELERDRLAERLLTVDLEPFLNAYRKPSLEGWRAAIEGLVNASSARGWQKIANTLRGAVENLPRILKTEDYTGSPFSDGTLGKHFQSASVQLPALSYLLRLVDGVLEAFDSMATVTHDAANKYEAAFRHYFEFLRNASGDPQLRENGVLQRPGLSQLTSIAFADSRTQSGLQLADILCGYVRRIFEDPAEGRFSPIERALISLLDSPNPTYALLTASGETKQRLLKRLRAR